MRQKKLIPLPSNSKGHIIILEPKKLRSAQLAPKLWWRLCATAYREMGVV